MPDQVSMTLSKLEVRIDSFKKIDAQLNDLAAEINRLEHQITSLRCQVDELEDDRDFSIGRIHTLLSGAEAEGFSSSYMQRFLKERGIRPSIFYTNVKE
jgi:septal ring factor EnvC (AmiA/AmiB activator)